MRVTSGEYESGEQMPAESATQKAGGRNVSPSYHWEGAPEAVRSFALEVVDHSARDWVHWHVVDIPASAASLPQGASGDAMPPGARELRNTFGSLGWGGPQPPPGSGTHRYETIVYALDTEAVGVDEDADAATFEREIRHHVIARGSLIGTMAG